MHIYEIGQEKTKGGNTVKTIDQLKSEFRGGRISRRLFMEGASALGLGILGANAFVSQVHAATPNRGGHLRQGFSAGSTTDSLDALKSNGSIVEICNNWCWGSNLTEVQPDGSIAPELAETMESSDGKTWAPPVLSM